MTFRLKTMLGIALIESILLIILVYSALDFLRDSNEDQLQKYANSTSRLFETAIKDAVLSMDLATLESFVEEIVSNPDIIYTRIISNEVILAQGGDLSILMLPNQPDKSLSVVTDGIYDIHTDIIAGGITYGVIEMGLSTNKMEQMLVKAQRWIGGIASLEIILVALFSFLLGTYLTKQLLTLKEASHTIAISGPGHQIPIIGNDEISDVAHAFNDMSSTLNEVLAEREKISSDLALLNKEKDQRADELILANKELVFQKEKTQRSQELISANEKSAAIRQETDKTKSKFISRVSHELRTPLTSIKGALGLIQAGVFDKSPEKLPSIIDIAYKNTERLHHLIDEILDIEKLESGKMSFKMHSTNISALLEEAIAANEFYGAEYGITFSFSGIAAPLFVNGDSDRLMQLMGNLLSNAAKFSSHGGHVEVTLARNDGRLRIAVRDYGCGIPQDAQQTIFEKFTQADSTDHRRQMGSGLGLNIAKMIVEEHDGLINFTTEVDKGTTFYVDLPELETCRT
ncbi:MAG: ATP-binding protein [Amylibacter sp.]|nr:ATP-binding protein [Amylibacter sp.]